MPHFMPDGEAKDAAIKDCFEKGVPGLMAVLDPYLKDDGFLLGENLTVADFFYGGLYVNTFINENRTYGHDEYKKALEDYPKFAAYGERFKAKVETYLGLRPKYPL